MKTALLYRDKFARLTSTKVFMNLNSHNNFWEFLTSIRKKLRDKYIRLKSQFRNWRYKVVSGMSKDLITTVKFIFYILVWVTFFYCLLVAIVIAGYVFFPEVAPTAVSSWLTQLYSIA